MKKIKIYVFCRDKLVEWEIDTTQKASVEFVLDKFTTSFSRNYLFNFEYDSGSYKLISTDDIVLNYKEQTINAKLILDGDIIVCNFPNEKLKIVLFVQFDDFFNCTFYKFKIDNLKKLTIGSGEDCDIVYENQNILIRHIVLRFGKSSAEALSKGVGVYLNQTKLTRDRLKFGDVLFLYGFKCVYLEDFIAINSPNEKVFTKLNPSDDDSEDYLLPQKFVNLSSIGYGDNFSFDSDENVDIEINPPYLETKGSSKLLIFRISSVLVLIFFLLCIFLSIREHNYILYTIFGISGFLIAVLIYKSVALEFGNYKEKEKKRYKNYLDGKFKELNSIKYDILKNMFKNYPTTIECYDMVVNLEDGIWRRDSSSKDFLNITLGLGSIYFDKLNLTSSIQSNLSDEDELFKYYKEVVNDYKKISDAPITLPLRNISKLAIVGDMDKLYDVFKNFIIQLTSLSSYDNLKISLLSSKEHESTLSYIKSVPHIYSGKNDFRYMAVYDDEYTDVLYNLRSLIEEREELLKNNSTVEFNTGYVVFIFYSFNTQLDTFLDYLKNIDKRVNVSVVLFTIDRKNVPNDFKYIINVDETTQTLYKIQDKGIRNIVLDNAYSKSIKSIDMDKYFSVLSSLSLRLSSNSIRNVDRSIFELYNAFDIEDFCISGRWRRNTLISSVDIPIAFKNNDEVFCLNIHEKQHGSNGIIFGDNSVGKTELIKTIVLSYSINFDPNTVNFIILKSNNGTKLNSLIDLPHVLDILDKDNYSERQRILYIIKNEIKKRQQLFDTLKINDIDSYLNIYDIYSDTVKLPHIVIIIDDVDKRDFEFIKEFTNLYSSMINVGIHIIVSSGDIDCFTDDDFVMSKFNFKICFRLQNQKDMLKIIDGEEVGNIKGTGRFNIKIEKLKTINNVDIVFSNNFVDYDGYDKCIDVVNNCGLIIKKIVNVDEKELEKTQQDAILNEICNLSKDINVHSMAIFNSSLRYLSLQDLSGYESNFNGFMWNESEKKCSAVVGIIDDPKYQVQRFLSVNFKDLGNLFVFGSPGTGKSTLIKTLVYSLCCEYRESKVNVYMIDLNTRNTDYFGYAPHVKDIAYTKDEVTNVFKKVLDEFEFRKKIFDNLDISSIDQYKLRVSDELPYIILTIDSLQDISNNKWDYINFIKMIARDGFLYGIYVCVTSSEYGLNETKICEYFENKFVLRLNDESLYEKILGEKYSTNSKAKGRGVLNYTDSLGTRILEFQVAVPMDAQNEVDLNNKLKRLFIQMNDINSRIYDRSDIREALDYDFGNGNEQLVEKEVDNSKIDLNDLLDKFLNSSNNLTLLTTNTENEVLEKLYGLLQNKALKNYILDFNDVSQEEVCEILEYIDVLISQNQDQDNDKICIVIPEISSLLEMFNDDMLELMNKILSRKFDSSIYFIVSLSKNKKLDDKYTFIIDSLLKEGFTVIVGENSDEETFALYKSEKISLSI